MITLEQANAIIEAVLEKARELDCAPVAAVVTEPGAIVKAFQKEDFAAMIRFEMAYGKAYAALAMGRSSHLVRVRGEIQPGFLDYMIKASGDNIFPEGGGQLIRNDDGHVIGAVGVTGDTWDLDDQLAVHGIRAASLKTDEDCAHLGNKVRLMSPREAEHDARMGNSGSASPTPKTE